MSEIAESKPQRLTLEQLHAQVQAICAANGYRLEAGAIGNQSGLQCPAVDVVAPTHHLDLVYVEVEHGAVT